ncbi:phage-related protein, HI1409 family [Fibrobacter sp. UWOV1]|uniref:anti-CBASS protein Acb1 family protein n=1 Tax=Fibrobacter sp. UWOV1 TaxID=1896215 RepID=UPI000923E167|nr:anti-CBASS Acb1 family protein [Fibrobacter sp. UWOV1]SHK27027.1 phage-related protein, HI1409 family [Fibrobacter sp. UWOV1]
MTTATTTTKKKTFKDGAYLNSITGLGMLKNDKTTHTKVNPANSVQNDIELANLYLQDGLATTIADAFPEHALADDIKIIGDETGDILKDLDDKGFTEAVIEAGTMARLFGGAAILTLYDGNTQFYRPPRPNEKVVGYKVYSAADFSLSNNDYVNDKTSPFYNEIELFKLNLENGNQPKIHVSRLTIFRNKKAPRNLKNLSFNQRFFGCSSVKEVDDSLKDLGSSMGGVSNMMSENGLKIFSLSGLTQMLSRPDSGVKSVQERMSVVNMALSAYHSLFQDKDDSFNMVSHNFTGIPEIVRLMMVMVCARSKIPMSILFGQTITGLAGTNEGDLKTFYGDVNRWRRKVLYRNMCKLITDFCKRNLGTSDLKEFSFAPLGALSGKEYVDAKFIQAQTCEKFFNMGAMTNTEIRKCALENGGTFELSVQGDLPEGSVQFNTDDNDEE